MVNIDWSRMAKPQDDMYDSGILSLLEHERCGWTKKAPETPKTFCDGNVGIRITGVNGMGPSARFATDEECSDFQFGLITNMLRPWEAGYTAMTLFLDALQAHWAIDMVGHGSMSGHHELGPTRPEHVPYVTINSPSGCAQGLYHELGHLRLEAMGVLVEHHDSKLLLNTPDELYNSSVRFDKKRPMCAVLHGLYAWLMFTENDVQRFVSKQIDKDTFTMHAARNIPKIEKGYQEVANFARWTPEGQEFFVGVTDWTLDLVDRAKTILGA